MDVFEIPEKLVDDYASFTSSFDDPPGKRLARRWNGLSGVATHRILDGAR